MEPLTIEVVPVTADRWADLEGLFGEKGAYAGCWCQWWRMDRADFKRLQGSGTRAALRDSVCRDEVPGLLAYVEGSPPAGGKVPAGWCSVGPRESFPALERSRILKRVDDRPVWSIVCFYIARDYRRRGLMVELLRGAIRYAAAQGAAILEGYPIDLQTEQLWGQKLRVPAGYMGVASAFREAGFEEVGRASDTQLIMRYISSE
jgi:GNAT superfamily N-acetyltransferase